MKRVLILNRKDLSKNNKLKEVQDIEMEHFDGPSYDKIRDYDAVIFFCNLFNQSLVLKDRYSNYGRTIFSEDDKYALTNFLLMDR